MKSDILTVLIVDDEHLVRDLLKSCLDWAEIGMQIIGEAANSREALDLVEELQPDIIFTDIYMPGMDGIEFSRLVKLKNPQIEIVIITGHDEFEYAKRSIKIGIDDFLLKPINDDELRNVAIKIKDKIHRERKFLSDYIQLKEQLEESFLFLKEKHLNELISGNLEGADLQRQMEYYRISTASEDYQVAVVEVKPINDVNAGEEDVLLLKMKGINIARAVISEKEGNYIFFDSSFKIVILYSDPQNALERSCHVLKDALLRQMECTVAIGISNRHKGIDNIKVAFQEARDAKRFKIIAGINKVILYGDLDLPRGKERIMPLQDANKLIFYIKSGIDKEALKLVDHIFSRNHFKQQLTISTVQSIACNLLSAVLTAVSDLELSNLEVLGLESMPFETVFRIETLPEMNRYLKKIITSAIERINALKTRKANSLIEQIQNYIHREIGDFEITLTAVADKFFVNPSYLSRIFKQKTGINFVEYLTKVRMEKAIELLRETDLRAYEIADQVGIADPHYFSICFKKYTNMSVSSYRKNLR